MLGVYKYSHGSETAWGNVNESKRKEWVSSDASH